MEANMAFVTDKSELKPGLILFRRGDVEHRMWYCRMKMPKADRYKTVSLKTTDIDVARDRAFDQDADIRFRLKHDVPVFNHPFREVGREYLLTQEARAKRGEISAARPKKVRAVIEGALDRYVGSTQVHLIGDELWGGYPAWRRENGAGRHKRNGVREVSDDMAQAFADKEAARRTKVQQTLGIRVLRPIEVKPSEERVVPYISDSTIRFEMSIFGAVNYAIKKRYVPTSQRFKVPKECLEQTDAGYAELGRWLQQIVLDSDSLRFADPAYADVCLDESGNLCQPGSRPFLRRFNEGPFAA
jgi:hypothetical protein